MINIIRLCFICLLFISNISYGQLVSTETQKMPVQACIESLENPIEKQLSFGEIKLKVFAVNKGSVYEARQTSILMDISQVARLQIATAYSTSDCNRWITQEREECSSSKKIITESCQNKIQILKDKYNKIVIENNELIHNIDILTKQNEDADSFKVKAYSFSIGIVVGVVSSIVAIKYF